MSTVMEGAKGGANLEIEDLTKTLLYACLNKLTNLGRSQSVLLQSSWLPYQTSTANDPEEQLTIEIEIELWCRPFCLPLHVSFATRTVSDSEAARRIFPALLCNVHAWMMQHNQHRDVRRSNSLHTHDIPMWCTGHTSLAVPVSCHVT